MKIVSICTSLLLVAITTSAQRQGAFNSKYPETRKSDHVDELFGTQVADPYRWLEDDRSAETKEWVKRENKVTETYLDRIPYRDVIRNRLTELWNYEKYSAPFKEGDYTYFF